jgi:hypothetical protein
MQKAVVKYGLDTAVIEAGKMGSGGKQTFYGVLKEEKCILLLSKLLKLG